MTPDQLDWPFFEDGHRALDVRVRSWLSTCATPGHHDVDAACRTWVRALGQAGFLRLCVPAAYGGASPAIDSRSLCLMRERLAEHDGLADFAFAMQGLGSGAISLEGSQAQRRHWLPRVTTGEAIAAFALSEPDAGSDVAAMSMRAHPTGSGYRLEGTKTWISNGGIADFYCVFARTSEEGGTRGISCFLVPADAPGLAIGERIDVIAPHPLARLEFDGCELPADAMVGEPGSGFKLAMRTLDIFRTSVAAAALGFARRALAETVAYCAARPMAGGVLGDLPTARATVGEMASTVDGAALLTYRAAWLRDVMHRSTTVEAAMAKMTATEGAQQVIDAAVQLHGARGVQRGSVVERLYREIRALRIYEGATEVQKLIVGRGALGVTRR
ncbi:MAG: acyl-CoA dehydrogenase family protein [Burkholderiales bacterium]